MKVLYLPNLIKMITYSTEFLSLHKDEVNALNVFPVPDGDTGINMVMTMQSALNEINNVQPKTIKEFSLAFRRGSLMGARGNSGVILSQIILGICNIFDSENQIDVKILKKALKQGSDSAYKAVIRPVEGTMLTVMRHLSESAYNSDTDDITEVLEVAIKEAEDILHKTPDMLPILKEAGVIDAGGLGLVYIFKGMLKSLEGKTTIDTIDSPTVVEVKSNQQEGESQLEFNYCTELLINNPKKSIEEMEKLLLRFGGSLLVVGDETMMKIHIHSNHPDKVLALALTTGEVQDIKIDNMRIQHNEYLAKKIEVKFSENKEFKKFGIVAVVMGKGMIEIYKNLGTDVLITGGQTMNPSVVEIISGIKNALAENIFLIINNKNIFLAAQEAMKVITDRKVYLLGTNHMVEGISALLRFNSDISPQENYERMLESIEDIWVAEITTAQRDGKINGMDYNTGDYIAITSKDEIVYNGKDINKVVLETIKQSPVTEGSIISLYAGEGIVEDWILKEEIKRNFKSDVEWYYGGQTFHHYFISVEV